MLTFSLEQPGIWVLPTRQLGRRVLVFDSVESTNDLATEAGIAVLADVQTAGRGQYGRTWICPPGTAIQLSLALDPPPELRRPAVLTAWASVAVAGTAQQFTNIAPQIKWPNDVLLTGRKVAGILIEQKSLVVAGIGLNVNQSQEQFESAGLTEAGSLASVTGRPFDRDAVARALIAALDADYTDLLDGNLATLESRWKSHIGLVGQPVEIETIDGSIHRGRLVELTFATVTIRNEAGAACLLAPELVKAIRNQSPVY